MYALVRVLEGGGCSTADVPEAARARVEALETAAGFVTLLAINGDDGVLVTVEIFETKDDMTAARADAGRNERGRTIAGEIVFQRGL